MGSLDYLLKLRALLSNIFIAVFGYLLPSLNSAKAVLNDDVEGVQEMLCYWSVFSVFVLTEFIFDTFLDKVPLYYELKAAFILYLTLPSTQGAYKLYHGVVHPYFEKYEDHIDDGINKMSNDAQAVAMKNVQAVAWHVMTNADKVVLDLLGQSIKYVLNFDPGTKKERPETFKDSCNNASSMAGEVNITPRIQPNSETQNNKNVASNEDLEEKSIESDDEIDCTSTEKSRTSVMI